MEIFESLEKIKILATTTPGFEEVALEEVEEITGSRGVKKHQGMIGLRGEEEDILKLNYLSKTLHRVLLLLAKFSFSDLDDIYQKLAKIDFSKFINSDQKFAARIQRHGTHNFSSMDVEREVGQAIIDSFKNNTGKELGVNLDNPDIIFRGEVRSENFWISMDTTGQDSLHKRSYRVKNHPAPLKPSIAHCLIRLSEWNRDESFIDPMCGSGTICIEAGLSGNNVPNFFRDDYDYHDFDFLDSEKFAKMRRKIDRNVKNETLSIFGNDISKKYIEKAKENGKEAGVKINFTHKDATQISLDYDKIVTNLPYGRRLGSKKEVKKLYNDFMSNLLDYSWKKAVILSGSPNLLSKEDLQETLNIKYGNLPAKALIFEK